MSAVGVPPNAPLRAIKMHNQPSYAHIACTEAEAEARGKRPASARHRQTARLISECGLCCNRICKQCSSLCSKCSVCVCVACVAFAMPVCVSCFAQHESDIIRRPFPVQCYPPSEMEPWEHPAARRRLEFPE